MPIPSVDRYNPRLIRPQDMSTRTIFGDAGTATLLDKVSAARLHSFVLGSDGRRAEQLMVKASRARFPRGYGLPTAVDDAMTLVVST